MISVIVPCGPHNNREFLQELLDSINNQTLHIDEVVIVDDAAHLDSHLRIDPWTMTYHKNQWNLGEAASRNIGTAIARNDWVFQASDDDILDPHCLEACWQEAERQKLDPMGYYYVTLQNGELIQTEPGAHAMFHRKLWAMLGGYPMSGAFGLADIGFIDLVMTKGGKIWPVEHGNILYDHRRHEHNQLNYVTDLLRHYSREASNELTRIWTKPEWIKGYGYA